MISSNIISYKFGWYRWRNGNWISSIDRKWNRCATTSSFFISKSTKCTSKWWNRTNSTRFLGWVKFFWFEIILFINFVISSLMPSDNRQAWRLPIIIFVIFLICIILVIIFVALGYTSVDYDEVSLIFIVWSWTVDLFLVWCDT